MRKLVILDIDETLLYATRTPLPERSPDFQVHPYHVYKRPHLDRFLGFCQDNFEVAVWTSGGEGYASRVVANIFREDYPLSFVWDARRCTVRRDTETRQPVWIKDLKKVKRRGYDLTQVLMVDNSPSKLKRNYGNLIAVRDFVGDLDDNELPALMTYLELLADHPNVRTVEKRGWWRRVDDA